MLPMSPEMLRDYDAILAQRKVASGECNDYKKWLRYYLDYCHKYHHAPADRMSFSAFHKKLSSKNQSESLCRQAHRAIVLYHEMLRANQDGLPLTGASWVHVFDKLSASIQVRHYSKKTLQAYRSWIRKFQAYTLSKPPERLDMDDVKNILTSLAVEKKVAASTQNQAFNALLFLVRHVLEKEFEQVEGVVRAKRKTYIPVVLSREEVDRIIHHLPEPYNLVVQLLYGCGLRLFECLKLRIQDLNFDMMIVTIHDGKG